MTLRLAGSTSGYVEIDSQAVGGNNTMLLPTSNGSANQFLKNGSTAGTLGWSSMVEDSSGRVLIGTSATRSWAGVTGQFQLEGTTRNGSAATLAANINSLDGSYLSFIKSRGTTLNSNTLVSNNDILGGIYFNGTDGSAPVQAAVIQGCVDGTPGTNSMPGRLSFFTTPSASNAPAERARITQAGHLLLHSTDPDFLSSGFYLPATETGQTPVRKFMISEFGQSNTAYAGQWRWYTSSGWGQVFKGGFRLHLRNIDNGSLTESGDLFRFDGNGAAYNATGTWGTITSNLNLKQDITAASSQWSDIKQIKFHKYRYIADVQQSIEAEEKTGVATEVPFQMGVIAEELEEICPNLVENSVDQEGNKTSAVKYSILYMKAVKALQEAMERIETLESANASQLATIAAMEARLTALEAAQ